MSRAPDRPLLRRIAAEATPFWRQISGLLVVELLAAPLALVAPLPIKIAVDNVVQSKPFGLIPSFHGSRVELLALAAILQVLLVVLVQLQDLYANVLRTRTGENMTFQTRVKLFRHAQRLSLLFHDRRGTTESLYRIQYDATSLQYVSIYGFVPLVGALVTLASTLYVIARIDWQLALIALAVAPLLFLASRTYSQRVRRKYRDVKKVESHALKIVQEVLSSLRVVKAFGREEDEQERFMDQSARGVSARNRLALYEGSFGLLVNTITAAGTAAVLFIGIANVVGGILTLGELLMVLAYLTQLYAPMKTISKTIGAVQSAIVSAERSFELLDELPDVADPPRPRLLSRASGIVEFRNVSFSYDGKTPILRNISFSVPRGSRVGIAGKTGAGKTTLINLIMRFFDVGEGKILLDGYDLRDFKVADLRSQFALVLQEPVLFSTSIAENIGYAQPNAPREDIVQAAKAANAHDFIVTLPHGYDELVGERGMRLSGGERQRISLARAFLKNAPILILDEPTSSVDPRTEGAILEALSRLMSNRTSIMIAHRPSTLRNCDLILVIDDGRLAACTRDVESGIAKVFSQGAYDPTSQVV